jgi:hypothetical protein
MKESELERTARSLIYTHGGLMLKWVSPGIKGVPDNIVFWPGGRVCLVEFKTPQGRLTFGQMAMRDALEAKGHKVFVVSSMEELSNMLQEYVR